MVLASKRIVFIVNPQAGNGSTGRQWPRIQSMARDRLGYFTSYLTARPGDAARIARMKLIEGAEVIVCVGGDGTLNEVVNGFMDESGPIRDELCWGLCQLERDVILLRLCQFPQGSNNHSTRLKKDIRRSLTWGGFSTSNDHGLPVTRYFHNIVSFGLGGEVDERINKSSKAFGPFISFIWATLVSVFLYGKKNIHIQIDNSYDRERHCLEHSCGKRSISRRGHAVWLRMPSLMMVCSI